MLKRMLNMFLAGSITLSASVYADDLLIKCYEGSKLIYVAKGKEYKNDPDAFIVEDVYVSAKRAGGNLTCSVFTLYLASKDRQSAYIKRS